MFMTQLFTLSLVVCAAPPTDGSLPVCQMLSVPGFASLSLCEAAAVPVSKAMRRDEAGIAVGRCVPSIAPREA